MEDFEYVLNPQKPAKICFGSGHPRVFHLTDVKKSPNISPATYNVHGVYNKIRSKRGTPGLANLAKRFPQLRLDTTPEPSKYAKMKYYTFKPNCAPFNSSAKRELTGGGIREGPGPIYKISNINKCKRTRLSHHFGKACVIPAVEMICVGYPTDTCVKCSALFEFGDFWHLKRKVFLCTFCMTEEHRLHELFTEKELLTFKKIRTCAFMHRHEGTTAAVKIMSSKDIKKKLRVENYLSLYMKCFGSKSHTELTLGLNETPP